MTIPVTGFLTVQRASALQTMQGSFLSGRHREVGGVEINPSWISRFRLLSNTFRYQELTQHLNKPPFFVQALANVVCSWNDQLRAQSHV